MDKNIAAILREDAKTIKVVFEHVATAKRYTYVTHLDVAPGDRVVVEARGVMTVAYIDSVDVDLDIAPNSDVQIKWVVGKVDIASHVANEDRNDEIQKTLGKAYRSNARQQFAQLTLASVSDSERGRLAKLIGGTA